jgi:RNA 3'-terminal phosphate cyclase (ATP)
MASPAPVDAHLCDQLLVPLALGAGGRFRTASITSHARTAMGVIRRFLGTRFTVSGAGEDAVEVEVAGSGLLAVER